ncbi:MAG: hypothetical protein ACYDB1_01125 [Acidiferrobacteraceae bacterium]
MTRKDYILIAHALFGSRLASDKAGRAATQYEECCYALADILHFDNPTFESDTFLTACGVEE